MDIKKYLKDNNISIRKMSIITGIPYTTLSEIVNGKVSMEDCQFKTLKPIANFCHVTVDDLVYQAEDFQTFRNKLHHKLVASDELDFVIEVYESKAIDYYRHHSDHIKALYLLSLVDYLSNKNSIPLSKEYSDLRTQALDTPLCVGGNRSGDCLKEFADHNIFEGDLYDAV